MKGKTLGRILGAGLAIFGTKEVARADQIYAKFKDKGINRSTLTINHTQGATEDFDGEDVLFLEAANPALDIYSKTTYPYPQDKLSRDSRPPESMTTINGEICGRGLSNPVDNHLEFIIGDAYGENNFALKRLRADLYDASDNLLASYDLKNLAEKGETIPITVNEGLTYKMKIRFYDIEDLNLDRIVDFKDYAEFAQHWKTSGHDMYDNWAGGADFNKDGNVNASDLAQFVSGWLLETQSVSGE